MRYVILERGEGSDPADFLKSFVGPRQLRTIYKLFGRYIFFYTIRPPLGEPSVEKPPVDEAPEEEVSPLPPEGTREDEGA